jgi:hypothetical protein
MPLMRSFLRPAIAIALLYGSLAARANVPQLQAPANGETLRGGSVARIDWSASPLPSGAEEWEAFLSIDGGGYYAFRITPHLDIERRSFTWLVPNVDTSNAKILLRTGDEKRERHFVMPGTFRIARDPEAGAQLPSAVAMEGAESAREGEADVLSWAKGDRAGTDVTVLFAPARRQTSVGCGISVESSFEALEPRTVHARVAIAPASRELAVPKPRTAIRSLLRAGDLLLACRRLNI